MSKTVLYLTDAFGEGSSPRVSKIRSYYAVIDGYDSNWWSFPRLRHVMSNMFYGESMYAVIMRYVLDIGEAGFAGCSNLHYAYLDACKRVGYGAFRDCRALYSASMPLCSYVDSSAFVNCTSMNWASLPKCEFIGDRAFSNCVSLSSVYLNLVTSVTSISSNTFAHTPIGGFSGITGSYGTVYVPSSLYGEFLVAPVWSTMSDRLSSV